MPPEAPVTTTPFPARPVSIGVRRLSGRDERDTRLAGLEQHAAAVQGSHPARPLRAPTPAVRSGSPARRPGLFLDYSKNRVTDETMQLLVALAEERGVAERRDAMFAGEHINVTEDRPVLHVALRMPRGRSLVVDGVDVVAEVHEVLDRMASFSDAVRSGEWRGAPGSRSATSSTSASAAPTSGP